MSALERRDRLAKPAAEQTYGEGFIAVHMKDGSVVTISGIVDMVEEKADMEDFIDWCRGARYMEPTGWNVTVHFIGNIVEEHRQVDGREVAE